MEKYSYVQFEVLKSETGYFTENLGRYNSFTNTFNDSMTSVLNGTGIPMQIKKFSNIDLDIS